ncbi:MAG: porin [Hyphomonadaceae bacterium]
MARSLTTIFSAGLAVTGAAAAPALAQDGEWETGVEVVFVGSGVEDGDPLAPAADSLMASALVSIEREDTLDNGFTIGWRLAGRYERDAPSRPAFAGVLGGCVAGNPACPAVGGLLPVSPATGLAAGGPGVDEEGFVALETASVSVLTPWGEAVVGADAGVATRLDARPPNVLRRASVLSTGLDPTGLSMTRARNDVTGASAKLSFMSPRWLGLRLGASWTPDANLRTADFDPDADGPGRIGAELENVWEGALSFARQFAEQDLRVRAAVTYSTAESGAGVAAFGTYEAWGAGLELEQGPWTAGVRWLGSNNAWTAGPGDYEAWEAGLVHQEGDWRIGIEAGWSGDDLSLTEGMSWLAGIGWDVNENVNLGVGWAVSEADLPVAAGPGLSHRKARNDGLLVELSVRN